MERSGTANPFGVLVSAHLVGASWRREWPETESRLAIVAGYEDGVLKQSLLFIPGKGSSNRASLHQAIECGLSRFDC